MLFQDFNLCYVLPFYASAIQAGFPSPADDYIENNIDLNDFLIKHPAATFMMRVAGSSMTAAGIFNHDVLVIDRSLTPKNQDLVVANLDGELLIRRLISLAGKHYLLAEGKVTRKIKLGSEDQLWGVVTGVIRTFS